jgi:hypothetical protein
MVDSLVRVTDEKMYNYNWMITTLPDKGEDLCSESVLSTPL